MHDLWPWRLPESAAATGQPDFIGPQNLERLSVLAHFKFTLGGLRDINGQMGPACRAIRGFTAASWSIIKRFTEMSGAAR